MSRTWSISRCTLGCIEDPLVRVSAARGRAKEPRSKGETILNRERRPVRSGSAALPFVISRFFRRGLCRTDGEKEPQNASGRKRERERFCKRSQRNGILKQLTDKRARRQQDVHLRLWGGFLLSRPSASHPFSLFHIYSPLLLPPRLPSSYSRPFLVPHLLILLASTCCSICRRTRPFFSTLSFSFFQLFSPLDVLKKLKTCHWLRFQIVLHN